MEENKVPSTQGEKLNTEIVAPKKKQPMRKAPVVLQSLKEELPTPPSPEEAKKLRAVEQRAKLRKEWEQESQKVTGVFRDLEVGAGGNLRFSARKYPWDQVENYDFKDGHTYTVPLWIARHLNENCKWPVYKHNIDPNAREGEKAKQYVNQWNHRFAFVSSDFIGIAKPDSPNIVALAL